MNNHPPSPPQPAYMKPLRPSYHRRAPWHDYRSRCIYMVTITKHSGAPSFGHLHHHGTYESAYIELTEEGSIVEKEILKTPIKRPEIKIISHVIMPDHIHILIFVKEEMEWPLGDVIKGIKSTITARLRRFSGRRNLEVFDEGFHDRILYGRNQLDKLINYISDNPRRLLIKQSHPDLFTRINHVTVGQYTFTAYGNIFLLDNFDCRAVIIHRRYTEAEKATLKDEWLKCVLNGGVLVSPFISPEEKMVRDETVKLGGNIIQLRNDGFPPRFKPSGESFDQCMQGTLLLLSNREYSTSKTDITRRHALELNKMAEEIAASLSKAKIT